MNFKNDKIILSFNIFTKYLDKFNINITEDILKSLCHENYVISRDKEKYICKMKYSEERIKKANIERLKKRGKNKIEDIKINTEEQNMKYLDIGVSGFSKFENNKDNYKTNKEEDDNIMKIQSQNTKLNVHTEILSPESFKNNICLSPVNNNCNNINNKMINNDIQESQTARSSSYLFDEQKLAFTNNELIVDVPDNILDIYDESDLKDQIIEKLEIDIITLRNEIVIKDKQIFELNNKIGNVETNSIINKIHDLNKLLFQKTELYRKVDAFIISLEKVPPKKISNFVNKRIINLKKEIYNINNLSKLVEDKIDELLNYYK